MKIEIGGMKPNNFQDRFPDEFKFFSHYEMALGIPHALFLITTLKENGLPNVCFQSWSSFSGDGGGFFAITPLLHHFHTYHNILRTHEFCVNFINASYFDACYKTVFENNDEIDELAVGGFHPEPAKCVQAPRIQEAFLSLDCKLHSVTDLSGKGISSLIIGRVVSASVDEEYLNGAEKKYGPDGFMYYLYALQNFAAGDQGKRKVASLNILRDA